MFDAVEGDVLDETHREAGCAEAQPEPTGVQVPMRLLASDKSATQHDWEANMTAPERSLKQRRDALERANDIRTKRAALKRNLKAGRDSLTITSLIASPPEYIETMKLWDLILATPKYGRVKVNKVLTQCRISPSKTIGGLSQRQRDEVVSLLRRDVATTRPLSSAQMHLRDGAGSALCRTRALRPRLTSDACKVTCLACANMHRTGIRAALSETDKRAGIQRPYATPPRCVTTV